MKSRTLYINDKTTTEDAKIKFATSKYELHQIVNESIHVLENLLFCTDLIFISQPNFKSSSIFTPKLPSSFITRNTGLRAKEH